MNSSVLAILLTSVFIFGSNYFFVFFRSKYLAVALQVALVIAASLLIYLLLNGRAAVIGACANIVYLIFNYRKLSITKNFLLKAVVVSTAVLVVMAFALKKDSSSGRLLIYKVVFTQLKPADYFWGLGIKKFKAKYNPLQADYFEQSHRDDKEILLAGNGYYLFNDWMQFALELGAMWLLLLACFVLFLKKLFIWQPHKTALLFAANGGLISISTAALFSYPFQVPVTFAFFIICVSIHIHQSYAIRAASRKKHLRFFLYAIALGLTVFPAYYCLRAYKYKSKSKIAFELYQDGFKSEAEIVFKQLRNYSFADYTTHYNYAYLLYIKYDLNNSLREIDKALNLAYSVDGVKLKADILWGLNDLKAAAFYYKQACYITPGKMVPKYNLLLFYLKTKQLSKAKYWANQIVHMPIKIRSATTDRILCSTQRVLATLDKHLHKINL